MSRHSLTGLNEDTSDNAFFPSLQKEMNRLFDQFRHGFPTPDMGIPSLARSAIVPAIDIVEKDGDIEITAEVPGVSEDDLNVSLSHDVLTLEGTKSTDHTENEDDYHLIERRYGSFRRQIPLGFTPPEDAVEAKFADGILTLRITKPAVDESAKRSIDIQKS